MRRCRCSTAKRCWNCWNRYSVAFVLSEVHVTMYASPKRIPVYIFNRFIPKCTSTAIRAMYVWRACLKRFHIYTPGPAFRMCSTNTLCQTLTTTEEGKLFRNEHNWKGGQQVEMEKETVAKDHLTLENDVIKKRKGIINRTGPRHWQNLDQLGPKKETFPKQTKYNTLCHNEAWWQNQQKGSTNSRYKRSTSRIEPQSMCGTENKQLITA